MTTRGIEEAATWRRDQLEGSARGRSSRPGERRCAPQPGSRPAGIVRAQMSLRDASTGGGLDFVGQATVYERGYEMWDWAGPYTEVVTAGAGSASLNRSDLDVPLVLAHDSLRRIARTTNGSLALRESDQALEVDAPGLDSTDADVAYIAPKLRSGLVDEMSFRFTIDNGQWSPDYSEYRINAYDIHRGDVAIVGYGASPHTSAGLRSADRASVRSTVRRDLRRLAASRALTGADAATVTALLMQLATADAMVDPIVDALCAADMALDSAQMTLASLLGLPNPDQDEDMGDEAGEMVAAAAGSARARMLLDMALADR